jgi:hypothetical protein
MVGVLTAHAEEFTYLTFELTDGTKASVPAPSLTLTFNGTTLTAGEQSFTLSNLSKMYFTTSDESTAGIEDIMNESIDEAIDIYDLQGHKVTKAQMKKGIYVVKTKNGTHKLTVR